MRSDGDGTPAGWLSDVTLEGADSAVRVVFMRREGSRVVVRQVDPCDPDPERIPLYEGDELFVMKALSHMSMNTNPEVGDVSGLLFGVRIVEVRREPGKVFARVLRRGEIDTGARVHVGPDESLTFELGFVAELDHIDDLQEATESGHVPITPVLATWFSIGSPDPGTVRYLLAAGRRLDTANQRLIEIEHCRTMLTREGIAGPEIRTNFFELLGAVESAIIALGRVVDMVTRANELIGCPVAVPDSIAAAAPAVTAIRNAYEHIEDRAVGRVQHRPHPDALTIFDYQRLISEDVIVYGTETLSLTTTVPGLLTTARQFLMAAAGDDWH